MVLLAAPSSVALQCTVRPCRVPLFRNFLTNLNPSTVSIVTNPCRPSPCGPNSQCREVNQQAVCSCLPSFIGAPPSCRPECTSNAECAPTQACLNQRCGDPCPGTCGVGANCAVVSHSPFCTCPERFTGNPFIRCQPHSKKTNIIKETFCHRRVTPTIVEPTRDVVPTDPCRPSPCGPYSQCRPVGEAPACSCLETYIGRPPNCRPECVTSSDCSSQLACVNQKCVDPCPGRCGLNAECRVVSHALQCICLQGYTGDPFVQCNPEIIRDIEIRTPCSPSPCGTNAVCRDRNGVGSCQCLPQYFGDPYEGCRPECMLDSDCPSNRACQQLKCQDPCPGTCGLNANCQVVNHLPTCSCIVGYVGDPYRQCNRLPERKHLYELFSFSQLTPQILAPQNEYVNPCQPNPCGPNSQCRVSNEQAVCSCLPQFVGTPPSCRPECTISSECAADKACVNQKCVDPCAADICGSNAVCRVRNHSPICSCLSGYTGDAFTRCFPIPRKLSPPKDWIKYIKEFCVTAPPVEIKNEPLRDPCVPTPCGPNSECRNINGVPACSCLASFIGQAPNCRPECTINSECPSQLACINQKCRDPCPGACGLNAVCSVINHTPLCACIEGYIGNPFTNCNPKPPERRCPLKLSRKCSYCLPTISPSHVATTPPVADDPCNPSPCGTNALCRNGQCSCIPEHQGDPYVSCRPECVLNTDCPRDRACVRHKCIDPCPGTCGVNALCEVTNHIPICRCPEQMSGNAFFECRPVPPAKIQDPCRPSPCGPNSQCRVVQQTAVCSCLADYVGSPPRCRPECVTNSDCPADQACQNMKCRDPCSGTCGFNALCNVVNHSPFCSCPTGMSGNPFVRCEQLSKCRGFVNSALQLTMILTVIRDEKPQNPCVPSPCGPNSECRVTGDSPSCSCLAEFIGAPPNCRPECISNSECPTNQACINQKCSDPCPGLCGQNANCRVFSHTAMCLCDGGFTGDPFSQCSPIRDTPVEVLQPCNPSPCGVNAKCEERGGAGSCQCLPDYFGNPYDGCRPECVLNSDCPSNLACVNQKCRDPCPGTCGQNAECQVVNHLATCNCLTGYNGDPYSVCRIIVNEPRKDFLSLWKNVFLIIGGFLAVPVYVNPCQPSPCGPNSQCREINEQAVCSCLAEFIGSPPACRPECTSSSECPADKACVNRKCVDPCPNVCGQQAECRVRNHNPICTCISGFTGDPFTRCYRQPRKKKRIYILKSSLNYRNRSSSSSTSD